MGEAGLAGLLGLLCSANSCEEAPLPGYEPRPETPTACGGGAATVALGLGDPFSPNPALVFEVEAGLQGGRHVDISLRLTGAFDPDAADVELTLLQGEQVLAVHATYDWLLLLPEEGALEPYCDYPRARLVLVDGAGGLLSPELLPPLLGVPLRLEVALTSALGDARQTFEVRLQDQQP